MLTIVLNTSGFMMEMSTWADAESRTIQFMVPKVGFSGLAV